MISNVQKIEKFVRKNKELSRDCLVHFLFYGLHHKYGAIFSYEKFYYSDRKRYIYIVEIHL